MRPEYDSFVTPAAMGLLRHRPARQGLKRHLPIRVAKNSKNLIFVVDTLEGCRLYTPHQRRRRRCQRRKKFASVF